MARLFSFFPEPDKGKRLLAFFPPFLSILTQRFFSEPLRRTMNKWQRSSLPRKTSSGETIYETFVLLPFSPLEVFSLVPLRQLEERKREVLSYLHICPPPLFPLLSLLFSTLFFLCGGATLQHIGERAVGSIPSSPPLLFSNDPLVYDSTAKGYF